MSMTDAAPLISACGGGDAEFLAQWARRDADGFAKCLGAFDTGAAALVHAVRGNHPECVLFMLQHVDANAADRKGHRPLVEASRAGHLRVLRILLDHGADPDSGDINGTALTHAAGGGFRNAVILLLERGARVNLQINGSPTALSYAACAGNPFAGNLIMRDLFAAGADPNLVDRQGESPLFVAAGRGHTEAAEMLLARGADVTLAEQPPDDLGRNALMMAASKGNARLAKLILDKAADPRQGGVSMEAFVNARASDGTTALMVAWSEPVAQVLLRHPQIDVDAQDEDHCTALVHAICADQVDVAEALLAHGASVKPDDQAETSALIEACRRGFGGLVRLILERGREEEADVDFRGTLGSTALMWACYHNFRDAADMLLRAGAAVDALDAQGLTPLVYAVQMGFGTKTALLLLERGADPNAHGPGWSPLIQACERSAPEAGEVCEALIRAGADLNAVNHFGATALQVAIDKNNTEAVKALLEGAGANAGNAQRRLADLKRALASPE